MATYTFNRVDKNNNRKTVKIIRSSNLSDNDISKIVTSLVKRGKAIAVVIEEDGVQRDGTITFWDPDYPKFSQFVDGGPKRIFTF